MCTHSINNNFAYVNNIEGVDIHINGKHNSELIKQYFMCVCMYLYA